MPKEQELSPQEIEKREAFLLWVEEEMGLRRLKAAHIADRGEISPGLVSMTLRRQLKTYYGPKFVRAVALAFDLPEGEVFARSGLVAEDAEESGAPAIIAEVAKKLSRKSQTELMRYAKYLEALEPEDEEENNSDRDELVRRANNLDHPTRLRVIAAAQTLKLSQAKKLTSPSGGRPRPDEAIDQYRLS